MLSIWTVGTIVVIYLGILFLIAFWGDKRLRDNQQHPVLYSLGLGVHCTSWAFFGTTAQAAEYGWALFPTYVGIAFVMLFAYPVILRISRLCQQHNISSLADFIALKYKQSHLLAALITLLCFVGVVPYIALQLDAITDSINLITPTSEDSSSTVGLYVAALMALFAILFGTRTLNLTDKHPGLLLTIAFESIIKLVGLVAVGLFVCYSLFDGIYDLIAKAGMSEQGRTILYADSGVIVYITHILLGICSMFVLPRQFHMNFIELNGESELRTARWLFPLYLLGMSLFLLPIALAGALLLDTSYVNAEAYVLALPLSVGNIPVSVMAFIGGLSATTSMVIVATLALGIMIANNVITPLWLKIKLKADPTHSMQPERILTIRRLTVLVVLSVAYWYHLNVSQTAPLVKSGIIAIALLSQALPTMMFGLYWRRRSKAAAQLALLAGFLCWVMLLLYPSIMSSYYFNPVPTDTELGLGYMFSLTVNCVVYVIVALVLPSSNEATQHIPTTQETKPELVVRVKDLLHLTQRVLEPAVHQALINQLSTKLPENSSGFASQNLLTRVEKLLTTQVGSPSARILLTAIADTKQDTLPELVEWVEEASQSFQFNHEVLQSSVQNIEQGISVVDQNLTMLAWNERYLTQFNYPPGFIKVGLPIHTLLQYNAERGLLGDVDHNADTINAEIEKRITYIKQGSRYKHVRKQRDGRVIELNGSPLPGGGYVTTYTDITEYIAIQEQLSEAKTKLEQRVAKRTEQLQQAKLEADKANESKTKFLAAAGHDLMQPFNAATLFAAMLANKVTQPDLRPMTEGLVNSLHSAESLLGMLLDMTKLDSGVLTPQREEVAVDAVLAPLIQEFAVICEQKSLTLRYQASNVWVQTDKKLLRRIVQNLLSNAIRYTESGAVLVGVRRLPSQQISICVLDTGPGIPKHQQHEIFNEFHQLESKHNNQGLGLGLTIVERMSHLLDHPVQLQSEVGKGTQFRVILPRVTRGQSSTESTSAHNPTPTSALLAHRTALLVENDAQITAAMVALLQDWGARVLSANNLENAKQQCATPPDLIIVDYHLDHGETGTETAKALREYWQQSVPGILNTANRSDSIRDEAAEADLHYLPKPLKPAALKRLLKQKIKFNQ